MKLLSKIICFVQGHDKIHVPYDVCEKNRWMTGIFTPYTCKRCKYIAKPVKLSLTNPKETNP